MKDKKNSGLGRFPINLSNVLVKNELSIEERFKDPKCILCDEISITTVVQIPVCKKHYDELENEGKEYLPNSLRPYYSALEKAYLNSIK